MWFFKNSTGWCQRHNPEILIPRPRKSRAPIFREQAANIKLAGTIKPFKPQAPKK